MRVELRGSNVRFSTKPRKKEGYYYCVPNSVGKTKKVSKHKGLGNLNFIAYYVVTVLVFR